jgi:hypothetical protein
VAVSGLEKPRLLKKTSLVGFGVLLGFLGFIGFLPRFF